MKVSILIPLYNAEKYIAQTIESAINQTYGNIEIVLIDDGSTDEQTLSVLQMYQNAENIVFIRQENKKLSAARNTGCTAAKGENDEIQRNTHWKNFAQSSQENKKDLKKNKKCRYIQ